MTKSPGVSLAKCWVNGARCTLTLAREVRWVVVAGLSWQAALSCFYRGPACNNVHCTSLPGETFDSSRPKLELLLNRELI